MRHWYKDNIQAPENIIRIGWRLYKLNNVTVNTVGKYKIPWVFMRQWEDTSDSWSCIIYIVERNEVSCYNCYWREPSPRTMKERMIAQHHFPAYITHNRKLPTLIFSKPLFFTNPGNRKWATILLTITTGSEETVKILLLTHRKCIPY